MNKIKLIFLTIVISFSFSLNVNSKPVPASFADLAEKLMPSVVNISTTTTVVTNLILFLFNFLQDLLLRICLKNLEHLRKDNQLL